MPRTLLLASLLLGCVGMASAGPIYKWVDAQGVTHFTAQPPQATQSVTIPPAKQPPAPASTPAAAAPAATEQTQADIDARVRRELAQKEKERAEYCLTVRTHLAHLRNNPRLRMEMNGEMRRVTEDERQAKIAEAEKTIAAQCP